VDPLDNVVWHALTGPQAELAETRPLAAPGAAQSARAAQAARAVRYPPDHSVFAALPDQPDDADWDALADLMGPSGVGVLFRGHLDVAPHWTELQDGHGIQMLGDGVGGRPDPEVEELGLEDVDEVLALIGRTQPGPFGPRTLALGRYVGLRRDGRLVAMAGERFHLDGWTEISAVCTDPDHRGEGLAGRLVLDVTAGIVARGEVPLLHVAVDNQGAARLYEALGFRPRRQVEVHVVRAPAGTAG
jgi:ribosomal protein S18 acetylase RimI-like enzyme